jgi:hypothetical protein
MKFEFVPLFDELRCLYLTPPGPQRFQAYIDLAVGVANAAKDIPFPPLLTVNPMAKEHALARLDEWIALDAEHHTKAALQEATDRLQPTEYSQTVKVGLSFIDDVHGGWTNRTLNDLAKFKTGEAVRKSGWLSVQLWTSETADIDTLRSTVLESARRAAYAVEHGDPKRLHQMIQQEGVAAKFASRALKFDVEELEYSRSVIQPYLDSTHQPTVIACLYGDDAAHELGYRPLGLSKNAGFQIALADALA